MKPHSFFPAIIILFTILTLSKVSFAHYFNEFLDSSLSAEAGYEGSEWWAPSLRAPTYSYKYQSALADAIQQQAKKDEFRLPGDILPTDYTIKLTPFLELGNFTTLGFISIRVSCVHDTNFIVLNAADLTIKPGSIQVRDVTKAGIIVRIGELIDEQKEREKITIPVPAPGLKAGKEYRISMNFVSVLNDELRGLYRSTYQENGATKYLAISQFEAPDARRAFPCFDEPNLKAKFTISIRRKANMTSVSNMPLIRSSRDSELNGYYWDDYQPSVKMPTYLVAMMVSEFVRTPSDPSLSPGVSFGIISRPGYEKQTKYAGNIGPRILDFFSKNYFGIDYPLPKQDMAAIPDFAAGAMENWGLITYREADLLFDEERSSEVTKQRIAAIIAHELAHQWFGNLVTMDWWNVLWLNEGFASYIEYIGADHVEKDFKMEDQFVVLDMHYVFGVDALESSRPINFQVNTPSQINQMFDAISYEKGSSILRMCAHLVGQNTFRLGISRYLNAHKFGNTVPDDLWSALQDQVNQDKVSIPFSVKDVMDSWTDKMGYPVVTIIRDYVNSRATISQKRFLLRKSDTSNDTTVYRWHIPLTYSSKFSSEPKTDWLSVNSDSTILSNLGAGNDQWIIFNVGQVGYYRVLYDDRNLKMIVDQLTKDNKVIPVTNRAQLLDDYLNMARANETSYVNALSVTKALIYERDYVPWRAASSGLNHIDNMLYGLPDYDAWKSYMTGLITSIYNHVGFTPDQSDSHLKIYTRSTAVSWACTKLMIPDCVKRAKSLFTTWMSDDSKKKNLISPNLQMLVSCTAVATSTDSKAFDFVFRKYRETVLGKEKNEHLQAMACTRNPTQILNLLNMIIAPNSGIRLQDANHLFSYIANSPIGHDIALDWVIQKWDDIDKYFSGYVGFGGGGSLPGFVRSLCNRVNNKVKLSKLDQLVSVHSNVLGSMRNIQQGMELARSNVQWASKFHCDIIDWLKDQNKASGNIAGTSTAPTPMKKTKKPADGKSNSATGAHPNSLWLAANLLVLLGITFFL